MRNSETRQRNTVARTRASATDPVLITETHAVSPGPSSNGPCPQSSPMRGGGPQGKGRGNRIVCPAKGSFSTLFPAAASAQSQRGWEGGWASLGCGSWKGRSHREASRWHQRGVRVLTRRAACEVLWTLETERLSVSIRSCAFHVLEPIFLDLTQGAQACARPQFLGGPEPMQTVADPRRDFRGQVLPSTAPGARMPGEMRWGLVSPRGEHLAHGWPQGDPGAAQYGVLDQVTRRCAISVKGVQGNTGPFPVSCEAGDQTTGGHGEPEVGGRAVLARKAGDACSRRQHEPPSHRPFPAQNVPP